MRMNDATFRTENAAGPVLERSDGLLEVSAGWTLSQAARFCRAHNWIFPLARPLPGISLRHACERFPFFADAFVAGVQGAAMGAAVGTPNAPRAAMGPDLLGGAMTSLPLFEATRLQIRVFDAARTAVRAERFSTPEAAAARLVDEVHAGRAFCIEAYCEQDVVAMTVLEAAKPGQPIGPGSSAASWRTPLRCHRGVSLNPGDASAIAASLANRERIVAAPFMGRMGRLLSARQPGEGSRPWHGDIAAACAALAQQLVRGPQQRESSRGK